MGAPEEIRERCEAPESHQVLAVLPEAVDTIRLFLALGTQWRFAGMDGKPTGLIYGSVEPVARMAGIELTEQRFEGLRIMEAEALSAVREGSDR